MILVQRLAILTTHPIQYNAPFFRNLALSGKFAIKVFYTWDKGAGQKHDPGFGQNIEWDIPLLDGYEFVFVKNTSKNPGSHHFLGIQNPTLINEIKNYKPDAILVYGWCFLSHLKAMRYFKGKIPVWFRGDSHLLDEKKDINTILRRLFLKFIYTYIDKAFYVGVNNKAYFLAHGLKEDQLVYMPHVVDNDFFNIDHKNREKEALEWRQGLGISDDDFVVLFAGKFEPKKNPELLVKTVMHINEQILNSTNQAMISKTIHIVLVGNGILESKLHDLANNNSYIHFLPFQNQSLMPIVYRLGNVFCLPSKGPGETWGLGVNEALASGRKVIVSEKVGCAADLITRNNGCIFPYNDDKSLRDAILTLFHDESRSIGKNLLPDNFSLTSNVNILNQICQ